MLRLSLQVAVFGTLAVAVLFSCKNGTMRSQSENGSPKIIVSPELYDFGTLTAGDAVTFSFKIENEGTGLLTVDSVVCECQCVEFNLSSEAIKPGEYSYLEVTYKSAGDWGNVIKEVQIFSNAIFNVQKVYISANVKNDIFD